MPRLSEVWGARVEYERAVLTSIGVPRLGVADDPPEIQAVPRVVFDFKVALVAGLFMTWRPFIACDFLTIFSLGLFGIARRQQRLPR